MVKEEIAMMHARCPLEAERHETDSLTALRRSQACPYLDFGLLVFFENCQTIGFCNLKPPTFWLLEKS